jgi:hypothetical protein
VKTHVVKSGEHLEAIALGAGLTPEVIWNHPKNAALKSQRKTPNVLAAGDILVLPDAKPTDLKVTPRTANRFVGTLPTIKMRMELKDEKGPIANEPFTVKGHYTDAEGTSDGAGVVEFEAATADKQVTLELTARKHALTFAVGGLDPVDTVSGAQSRLAHLGFLRGRLSGRLDEKTVAAIKAFQSSKQLEVTGIVDEATAAALQAAYGC